MIQCDCPEWKKWAWLLASRKNIRWCPYCGKSLEPKEEEVPERSKE